MAHGTGALNIDGCRIAGEKVRTTRTTALGVMNDDGWQPRPGVFESHDAGRWPANVVLDEIVVPCARDAACESSIPVSIANRRGADRWVAVLQDLDGGTVRAVRWIRRSAK